MKAFNLICAAFFALLVFCGCSDNSLAYVAEDAEVVLYGNVKSLLDSKVWEIAQKDKNFKKEVLDTLKEIINVEPAELSGNFAVWGVDVLDEGDFKAVVVLDEGNAEDVFKKIAKKAKKTDFTDVEEDEIDECKVITIITGADKAKNIKGKVEYSVVLVSDKVLQITVGDEADAIFPADNASETAGEINKDAVLAVAGSPAFFKELAEQNEIEVKGLGIGVAEVFLTGSEIQVNARIDISDVE